MRRWIHIAARMMQNWSRLMMEFGVFGMSDGLANYSERCPNSARRAGTGNENCARDRDLWHALSSPALFVPFEHKSNLVGPLGKKVPLRSWIPTKCSSFNSHGLTRHNLCSWLVWHFSLSLVTRKEIPIPHVCEHALQAVVSFLQSVSHVSKIRKKVNFKCQMSNNSHYSQDLYLFNRMSRWLMRYTTQVEQDVIVVIAWQSRWRIPRLISP